MHSRFRVKPLDAEPATPIIVPMKLTYRQIETFVRQPDSQARVILVYGPDAGLVKERSATIGRTIAADLNDPFNAVTLTGGGLDADPARLADEASAMSMLGGSRLIRIEDAGDGLTPLLKEYLLKPSAHNLVVIEAGALAAKSPLRALCEKSPAAAALPCYVDEGRDLAGIIRETMQQAGYGIEPDALTWLAQNIAGDRQRVRGELEKILLYMGPIVGHGRVTLKDATACCGEAGALGLDDLAQAVASRQPETALRCYSQLMQEGVAAVAVLRALQSYFRRLHLTQSRVEAGMTAEEAMKRLSPPVFFKQEESFKGQLRQWGMEQIESVLQRLSGLEAQTKQTGTPVETLCGQALLSLSRRA